jgi:hypothetical protein
MARRREGRRCALLTELDIDTLTLHELDEKNVSVQ